MSVWHRQRLRYSVGAAPPTALSKTLTLELAVALTAIEADVETQDRYDQLAAQHTEGSLTSEAQAELESIVRANTLLGVLKAEAHTFLVPAKPS